MLMQPVPTLLQAQLKALRDTLESERLAKAAEMRQLVCWHQRLRARL